jgi:uncharacterized phiE125 gp8 family phage protein
MAYKLITPPAAMSTVITLAEAKNHLRVDSDITEDDALITDLLDVAGQQCEHELEGVLLSQTWERTLDAFPVDGAIELAKPPILTIVSVKYTDVAGTEQTVNALQYTLDERTLPGWVVPAVGYDWPATQDAINAVRVRFTCGYTTLPKGIKQWILMCVGSMYENRELAIVARTGRAVMVPVPVGNALLDRYRFHGLA